MSFGTPHRHYRQTDSTNTRARGLAGAGAPHGTVVTAAEQTAGRGRQGRTWTAPAGKALLYSAVVRPLDERHLLLPLAVPLAVCEAAEQLAVGLSPGDDANWAGAAKCMVKWPNDVWVGGRKLAGVLIEARPQDGWAVVGVGLNLTIEPHEFPSELRETATSLAIESTCPSSPTGLIKASGAATEALNRKLADWVGADQATVLSAWRQRDALLGRKVAWDGGSGVADGVDDRGYLLVLTPDGDRVAVGAGEVHLRL
ncbi:MAG TPA: biotin--[acetyl-CoA-carboxylase] ligase [Solirubrobacterales bacterium]|nr:biotin--[acetyl-CoA-carboxylase] ligase [Solirubrobacterales bacterium]